MSDDNWSGDEGEINEGRKSRPSIMRRSDVTEHHDTIFDVLSVARRRYLVYYLFSVDVNVVEFEAAVNAVCKYEAAGTESDDDTPRRNVRVDLHHTQIPRLAEAGLLDYDSRQGTIQFQGGPALEEWAEHVRYKELN